MQIDLHLKTNFAIALKVNKLSFVDFIFQFQTEIHKHFILIECHHK